MWGAFAIAAVSLAPGLLAQPPQDPRQGPARTLDDAYHPWVPPATRAAWERAAARMRTEVRVALGLWPEPPRTPLEPRFGPLVVREGFSAQSVSFRSLPGFVVTGTLFRPHPPRSGRGPAVLSPHGHWPGGRLHDAGETAARAAIARGGERFVAAARHPLQARMVRLARLGCTGLLYDMVGYGSSRGLAHRAGFTDARASAHLHSTAGLQTWNSIRALDFLGGLEDVDPNRIGVTGASGGGTQTVRLGAVDPRPAVAFPAVMVSTAMQGGCVCENAPYLRIGRNNVALAALFAPRPLAMSGADDWTRDLETRGLPELRAVYRLLGAEHRVHACVFHRFGHNYNALARACMVRWFATHLRLEGPLEERDFRPLSNAELDLPAPPADAAQIRAWRERVVANQLEELLRAREPLKAWRRVVGVAADVLLGGPLPRPEHLRVTRRRGELLAGGIRSIHVQVTRRNGERVPVLVLAPRMPRDVPVLLLHGAGARATLDEAGRPTPFARRLLALGRILVVPEPIGIGFAPIPPLEVDRRYPGYTFCYQRPLLAEQTRDVLAVLAALPRLCGAAAVDLVAYGGAGPLGLLARARAGRRVRRTLADLDGFAFGRLRSADDPRFLPGALRYGGLGGLAACAADAPMRLYGVRGASREELRPLQRLAARLGNDALEMQPTALLRSIVEGWLQPRR